MKSPVTRAGSDEFVTESGTVGDLPWCDIFNTESYFRIHEQSRSRFYSLRSRSDRAVHAVAHFSELEPGIFRSPARGTYAGIDLQGDSFDPLLQFVDDIEADLAREGARRLVLSAAPFAHDPQKASWLFQNLTERGWSIELSQLNYSVEIDDVDLFRKMKHNNRKRVKKCRREGFSYVAHDLDRARDVYDVVLRNRAHRGYPISMSFDEVWRMVEAFPGAFTFHAVHHEDAIAAAAVCIRLNARVLYTLYWGDQPGYGSYSPVAMLADGIYATARDAGFRLMDTGTVPSLHSGPAAGLIRFKENVGCRATLKLTYTKTL